MNLSRLLLTATVVALVSFARADEEAADPPGRVAQMSFASGNVSFEPAGSDTWVSDVENRPLSAGDRLWVDADARAELHVGSAAVRFDGGTAVQVMAVDDQTVQLRLSAGTVQAHLRHLAQGQTFEIDTPNAAVTLLGPGIYRLDVADVPADSGQPQDTRVAVVRGSAQVSGTSQSFSLAEGQWGDYTGDELLTVQSGGLPPTDSFDRWADQRDRHEDGSVSAQYVSREMTGYEELDDYGSWESYPTYGQVWVPVVDQGWAPYQNGHWIWVAPWGWTWIDNAPWGFAPAHYGRWAWLNGHWVWCPGPIGRPPIYAPALVGWVGGLPRPGLVAWFALGWNEVYVPPYHSSPHYFRQLNLTNTYLTATYLNNSYVNSNYLSQGGAGAARYANARVPGAVNALAAGAFAAGGAVRRGVSGVPESQLNGAQISASVPSITPTERSIGLARGAAEAPPSVWTRAVVAHHPAPAGRIAFGEEARLVAANGGRPVAPDRLAAPAAPASAATRIARAVAPIPTVPPHSDRVYQPRTYADRPPYGTAATASSTTGAATTAPAARPEGQHYSLPAARTTPLALPEAPVRHVPAPEAHVVEPAPRAPPPERPAPAPRVSPHASSLGNQR